MGVNVTVYVITENGEEYATLGTEAEALKYLDDLRKVYPAEEFELIPRRVGRLPGQEKMIWGAECVVDLLTFEIHGWAHLFLWESQTVLFNIPKYAPRYLVMHFASTSEAEGRASVRRRLGYSRFISCGIVPFTDCEQVKLVE